MTINILMGVLVTIALSLAGFALGEIYRMNAVLVHLVEEVDHEIEIKRTLSKHWKLHSWCRGEINHLRYEMTLPPAKWPSLTD